MNQRMSMRLGAVAALGAATTAALAEAPANDQMQRELETLRSRIAQIEANQQQSWLDTRRAEEVKSLIREVLSDADTRASLMQEGVMAGISDKGKIFLQSADGSYLMNVNGQIQYWWVFNAQDDESRDDPSDDAGFQFRRIRLDFSGHIGDPKLSYVVNLSGARGDGDVSVIDAKIGYKFDNGLKIDAGKFKLPFTREELQSARRLLAVERGIANEYFSAKRSEQVQLAYQADMWKVAAALSDGATEEFSSIGSDNVEYAITARGDLKLAGEWKQADETTCWPGEELGAFVGGAIHYQAGKSDVAGATRSDADYLAWTVDGLVKTNGLGVMAAVYGGHVFPDESTEDNRDMLGFEIQAGYHITKEIEPFVRWEIIDGDDPSVEEDVLQAITLGVNYYFKGHNAKLTTDLVIVYDGDATENPFGVSATGSALGFSGFSSANEDPYFMIRSQFQLLF